MFARDGEKRSRDPDRDSTPAKRRVPASAVSNRALAANPSAVQALSQGSNTERVRALGGRDRDRLDDDHVDDQRAEDRDSDDDWDDDWGDDWEAEWPADDEAADLARSMLVEVSAEIVEPSTPEPDLGERGPLTTAWARVAVHLPYSDLASLMSTCHSLWEAVMDQAEGPQLSQYLSTDETASAEEGRALPIAILRCVGRGTTDGGQPRGPGAEAAELEEVLGRRTLPALDAMGVEIARALGWRHYTATVQAHPGSAPRPGLAGFLVGLRRHVQISEILGGRGPASVMGAVERHPIRPYREASKVPDHRIGRLLEEWRRAYRPDPSVVSRHPLDVDSCRAVEAIKDGKGDHISTLSLRGQQGRRQFSNKEVDDLGRLVNPCGCGPGERHDWGLAEGVGRYAEKAIPLPLHSESQAFTVVQPWQIDYLGGSYLACLQCLAAYRALGLSSPENFAGSHGQKHPSVIPTKVRENSVYLEQYLLSSWPEVEAAIERSISLVAAITTALDAGGENPAADPNNNNAHGVACSGWTEADLLAALVADEPGWGTTEQQASLDLNLVFGFLDMLERCEDADMSQVVPSIGWQANRQFRRGRGG